MSYLADNIQISMQKGLHLWTEAAQLMHTSGPLLKSKPHVRNPKDGFRVGLEEHCISLFLFPM